MLKKKEIYVSVESKEQAEMFRTILEAIGEPISTQYFPFRSGYQLRLSIHGNWLLGEEDNQLSKITFGELIDLLQRKTLFKANDGVDIYVGDKFYIVNKSNFNLKKWGFNECIVFTANEGTLELDTEVYFSSESKSLEWIESQKPKIIEVEDKFGYIALVEKGFVTWKDENIPRKITQETVGNILKAMEELDNA